MNPRATANPPRAQTGCAPGLCPLCGQPNHCQLSTAAAYKGRCWCMKVNIPDTLLARVPVELRNQACICRACVTGFQPDQCGARPIPVLAGDFYFDPDGLMVFTEAYHLRRGYCCCSGCRHCPYPRIEPQAEEVR